MRSAVVPKQLLGRPFTLTEAEAAGLTRRSLQSLPWRHICPGVWAHRDVADSPEFRYDAVRLVLPEHAVVCLRTAAWLYGVDVHHGAEFSVHVSFARGNRRPVRAGVRVSQETLAPTDIWVHQGVQVTSPLRTAFDSLRLLPPLDGLIVTDYLARAELVELEELRAYFAQQRRLRNLRIGERRLEDAEPLSESPMETWLRVGIVRQGLPRPQAQYVVHDPHGNFVARVDLAYPEMRIAIEYDGAWHWNRRREDDRRRDALRALGWIVIVVSAEDVFHHMDEVCARIRAARRRALSAS
jgi:hypothetical protein